jgi:hypothetical protein
MSKANLGSHSGIGYRVSGAGQGDLTENPNILDGPTGFLGPKYPSHDGGGFRPDRACNSSANASAASPSLRA